MGIGRNIRLIRTARGLNLSQLAEKTDLSASYLSTVENDRRQPSLKAVNTIASVLAVPPSALLWDESMSQAESDGPAGLISVLHRILREMHSLQERGLGGDDEGTEVKTSAEAQASR